VSLDGRCGRRERAKRCLACLALRDSPLLGGCVWHFLDETFERSWHRYRANPSVPPNRDGGTCEANISPHGKLLDRDLTHLSGPTRADSVSISKLKLIPETVLVLEQYQSSGRAASQWSARCARPRSFFGKEGFDNNWIKIPAYPLY
jgi:hypothetical protein